RMHFLSFTRREQQRSQTFASNVHKSEAMQYTAHFVVFLIFPLQQRDSEQQGDVLSSLWPRDRATLLAKDMGIDPNRPSTLSSSGNGQISEKGCLPLMVKGFLSLNWEWVHSYPNFIRLPPKKLEP
ncbi:hypothetical protein AABB24_017440, partial [Solanum stoloniferum]